MKKLFSTLLVLTLVIGAFPVTLAETPENAGPPTFELTTEIEAPLAVRTTIVPMTLSVYAGQPLELQATTTYTSNKGEQQLLHFVSDAWMGVDSVQELQQIEVEADPAAGINERQKVFVSIAQVIVADEPGEYDVAVTYTITLQHDASLQRIYTSSATQYISITVMEGMPPEQQPDLNADDDEPDSPAPGTALNHGQIVSAWAHWKQTKGNKNFMKGGPGVYRSLVWYKTQVEYKTFYSQQEVWDYLESIYEPSPDDRGNRGNPNKGPGNNNGNPNPNKGPGNNSGNPGKGK